MRRVDSRRVTGPHLLGAWPGAAVEVALEEGETHEAALAGWIARAQALVDALGWPREGCSFRYGARRWDPKAPGAIAPGQEAGPGWSLALASPPDLLETACLVAEQAADGVEDLAALREEAAREANPALRALLAHALAQGWPAFWDDEGVTLGHGPHGRTWPLTEVPAPGDLGGWAPGRVPVALVTGTNGKTTSSRLLARMARAGGHAGLVVPAECAEEAALVEGLDVRVARDLGEVGAGAEVARDFPLEDAESCEGWKVRLASARW
jgi:hypothetical protein